MSNNNSYLQERIMEQSRHQFIYGYNGEDRKQFLKDMVDNYSITLDSNKPIGIYLNSPGLPKIKSAEKLDKNTLSTLSREYCNFSIIINIIDTTLKQVDANDLTKRGNVLLERMNSIYLRNSNLNVATLQELKDVLSETQNAYAEEYQKYNNSGNISSDFVDKLPITFINLNFFVHYYKEMLGVNSFIGLVVDQQKPICLKSQQVINGLVGSRINKDISMKVACEPCGWETYVDLSDTHVERVHDYGVVELDDSYKEHIKVLKRQHNFKLLDE